MIELQISHHEEGLTPVELLQRRIPAAPAAYLRQLLRKNKVLLNRRPAEESSLLSPGDTLALPESARVRELLDAPPPPKVTILFEDRNILIALKPAGLAIHESLGHENDNLLLRVRKLLKERRLPCMVAPIHRLDLETSGPVLFGKGRAAVSALGKLFIEGDTRKVYLALVAGKLEGSGTLNTPVSAKGKVKEAATGYRSITSSGRYSLVELELHSGRTHQIRQQLADAGHPLAGDRRYGGPTIAGLQRTFLHCRHLGFLSPFDNTPIRIDCPLDSDLERVLNRVLPNDGRAEPG